MMLTISLLIVLLSLFYYLFIKPMGYWKDRGVRQTKPLWIFGDMLKTTFRLTGFHDWVMSLYNAYPESRYYGFYQYTKATLLLRDLELIKQVTVKDFEHFEDHGTLLSEDADPLWANNLFALKGQKWRKMRPVLSPFFTSSKMKQMFCLMTDCANKFTDYFLEKGEEIVEVEFKDAFTRYANDVIGTSAFGIETDSLREPNNEFYRMGKEATSFTGLKKSLKLLALSISPKLCEIFKVQFFSTEVRHFFYNLVDEKIRFREEKSIFRPDMIHLLTDARKGNAKQEHVNDSSEEVHVGNHSHLPNQDIAAQAMSFFFAGFDSVSTLLSYMAYELAANRHVQDRLRDEVLETITNCGRKPTYDGLVKMEYMDMVVTETLRKWPIDIILDRECTKPYKIEPCCPDEKPLYLEKNDLLWIPIYCIHHDEKYYPDPERFDPERFSEENRRAVNPLPPLTFGLGPRNCIGSRFALLETKALIFYILYHFEIVPTGRSKIPIEISSHVFQMLPKDGFWFGLKRLSYEHL